MYTVNSYPPNFNNFKINYTNSYIEYYRDNIIRRWKYNNNNRIWYEFLPDYNNLTIGKFKKTGRRCKKPLKPEIYYGDNNGFTFEY